jgi:hypothetical protein
MERQTSRSRLLATAGCLGLMVTVTWAIRALPPEVSAAFCTWVLASLPIGILIGHCALSED